MGDFLSKVFLEMMHSVHAKFQNIPGKMMAMVDHGHHGFWWIIYWTIHRHSINQTQVIWCIKTATVKSYGLIFERLSVLPYLLEVCHTQSMWQTCHYIWVRP